MRSFATRLGLAVLLTWGPVLITATPAGAATWCVPATAREAYDAILVAAPDGSAYEVKARQIADDAEAAGQFETADTLTRLDDLAYDNGYLYDCDARVYTYAPAETGYQAPTSSTTTTTRPPPTTTTTRPPPTTTTTRPAPAATVPSAGAPPAPVTPAPPAPGPAAPGPSAPATLVTTMPAQAAGAEADGLFTDEPLSVFPSGGLRPEGGGPEVTSAGGGESATGAPLTYRREAVDRSLLPAPVRMAMKAIAVTFVLCLAGLAVAVMLNRRRTTPDAPPVA